MPRALVLLPWQAHVVRDYDGEVVSLIPAERNLKADAELRNTEHCDFRGLLFGFVHWEEASTAL